MIIFKSLVKILIKCLKKKSIFVSNFFIKYVNRYSLTYNIIIIIFTLQKLKLILLQ